MSARRTKAARPKFDLVTIGDATWDAVVTGADTQVLAQRGKKYLAYPYGEKVHLENAYFSYGGGAANVAVSAARLGLKVGYLGSIGTDKVGQDILAHFRNEGVDTSMVERDTKTESALAVVLTASDGERTILLDDGSNRDLNSSDIPWEKLLDTEWLYLASLPGAADKLFNRLAKKVGGSGVKLALNPGAFQIKHGTRGLHAALENCQVLLLNDEEAFDLLRRRGHSVRSVAAALKKLSGLTGGIVVVTKGQQGVSATDGERLYELPASSVDRVNTVGAGDAFGSTLVAALAKGKAVPDALTLASLNASAVVSDYTAQDGLLRWSPLLKQFRAAKRYRPTVSKLPTR